MKKKIPNSYYEITPSGARFVVPSVDMSYRIGDHVSVAGHVLIIRKFRGGRVFCFDTTTKFGSWFDLYELVVCSLLKGVDYEN